MPQLYKYTREQTEEFFAAVEEYNKNKVSHNTSCFLTSKSIQETKIPAGQ